MQPISFSSSGYSWWISSNPGIVTDMEVNKCLRRLNAFATWFSLLACRFCVEERRMGSIGVWDSQIGDQDGDPRMHLLFDTNLMQLENRPNLQRGLGRIQMDSKQPITHDEEAKHISKSNSILLFNSNQRCLLEGYLHMYRKDQIVIPTIKDSNC